MRNLDGTLQLDPQVEDALISGRRRERERTLTPARRKRAQADRQRNRRMIDLDPRLESTLVDLAGRLSVPVSQLISWLVIRGLDGLELDELRGCCTPSRSMRYENNLTYPVRNP